MMYEDNKALKDALDANLDNIIKSLILTASYYAEDKDLIMSRDSASLILIASELHNISETLKSIDETLKKRSG